MTLIVCLVWNVFVLGGTVYLVGWQGWSAWWIVLAIALLVKPQSTPAIL